MKNLAQHYCHKPFSNLIFALFGWVHYSVRQKKMLSTKAPPIIIIRRPQIQWNDLKSNQNVALLWGNALVKRITFGSHPSNLSTPPPPCQPSRQTLLPKCYWRQREVMHLGWLYMWICLRDKNLNGEIIYECNWPNLDLKMPMKTMTLALVAIGRC